MEDNFKKCPNCMANNNLTAKFCRKCGYDFYRVDSDDSQFINDKLNELNDYIGATQTSIKFKELLKNNGLSARDGEDITKQVEYLIKTNNLPKNVDETVNELIKIKVKDDALELLNLRVGSDANRFFFKSRLYGESLSRDPHGFNIYNQLKKLIDEGKVNQDNFDDEFERLIRQEVENKNNELKNRINRDIGQDSINPEFLERISKFNLTEDDALIIRDEMLDKIDGRYEKYVGITLDDYDKLLEETIEKKASVKYQEISKQKEREQIDKLKQDLNNLLGKNTPSIYFESKLKTHHLTTIDGNMIKKDLIYEIERLNVGDGELENRLDELINKYEYDDVKNELNNLSSVQIDKILSQNSISTLIPLKFTKIEKLMYEVPISKIKHDLYSVGVLKYVIYDENVIFENACPTCGFENKETAKFCINCGFKF